MEKFHTCEEVSDIYGVKIRTVWDWIRKKKLSALKIGKEYRIADSDLKAFENKCRASQE